MLFGGSRVIFVVQRDLNISNLSILSPTGTRSPYSMSREFDKINLCNKKQKNLNRSSVGETLNVSAEFYGKMLHSWIMQATFTSMDRSIDLCGL